MKNLFIIPTRATKVLPNNYLYCKVYKGEEVNKFNIKEEYKADAEWLLELSADDIQGYVQFYYGYIINQLNKHIELEGEDYKEVETAIDIFTLLMWYQIPHELPGLEHHNGSVQHTSLKKTKRICNENRRSFSSRQSRLQSIIYWYNFNN